MKLTEAHRKSLKWFRDNDGGKFYPVNVSRRVINTLIKNGLLREERPQFGFVRTFITDLGRAALGAQEKGERR